jgi:hypothetical protein
MLHCVIRSSGMRKSTFLIDDMRVILQKLLLEVNQMLIQAFLLFAMVIAVQVVLVRKVADYMTELLTREPRENREIPDFGKSTAA